MHKISDHNYNVETKRPNRRPFIGAEEKMIYWHQSA
jgi:hypothetical protein